MSSGDAPAAVVVDDVLEAGGSERIRTALGRRETAFERGTTTAGGTENRRALVLDERHLGSLMDPVARVFVDRMTDAGPALGFDVDTLADLEILVLATVDGGGYTPHVDRTRTGPASRRRLSAVLFLHRSPRPFVGGDLVVGSGPLARSIEPVDGRLVVFRADVLHEVRPVAVPSGRFEDSRFSFAAFAS